VHYVIVSIPRAGSAVAHVSDLIEIPMEITDAPLDRSEGQIGKGELIAVHTLRALDAVVLLEPIQGRSGEIPAGRVLTQVVIHHGAEQKQVYCDLNIETGRRSLWKWDCFNDSQGVGRLDDIWEGRSSDAFMGFWTDPNEMNWKRKLPKSAAYRKAALDERPTGEIGYAWCGGDAVNSPARFSVSGHWSHYFFESAEADACGFGVWADPAAKGLELIDRIKATIGPGGAPNSLAFKVQSRIPPGPIAHLAPNGGIVAMEAAKAEVEQEVEELRLPPFLSIGAPPKVVPGVVAKGQAFYTIDVKHSITGVLTNEVHTGTYAFFVGAQARPHDGLAPGQVMYGARVGGAIEPQIVWCAPISNPGGTWPKAVCLPNNGVGTLYLEAQPAMMGAAGLVIPATEPPYAAAPIVDRRDIALPPMALSYAFVGWDKGSLSVQIRIDWGQGAQAIQTRTWSADSTGVFHLPVVGGEVLIAPTPGDAGTIKVLSFAPSASPGAANAF